MFSISHVGYDCPIPSCLSNFSPISYHLIPFFSYSIWVFHHLNFFYFLFSIFFSSLPLNCLSFPCSMRLSFLYQVQVFYYFIYISCVSFSYISAFPFPSIPSLSESSFFSFLSLFVFSFFLPSFKL